MPKTGKNRCTWVQINQCHTVMKNHVFGQIPLPCLAFGGRGRWCFTSVESKQVSLNTDTNDKAALWYFLWRVNYQWSGKKAAMLNWPWCGWAYEGILPKYHMLGKQRKRYVWHWPLQWMYYRRFTVSTFTNSEHLIWPSETQVWARFEYACRVISGVGTDVTAWRRGGLSHVCICQVSRLFTIRSQ